MRMSNYGAALRQRRNEVGYERQADLAEASTILSADDKDRFERFSQQWLSRLEADGTGEIIRVANRNKLRTLIFLLKWQEEDFEQAVGIPVVEPDPHELRNQALALIREQASVSNVEDLLNVIDSYADQLGRSRAISGYLILYVDNKTIKVSVDAEQHIPEGARLLVELKTDLKDAVVLFAWSKDHGIGWLRLAQPEEPMPGIKVISRPWDNYKDLRDVGVVRQVTYNL
jgi:hypothetical protein